MPASQRIKLLMVLHHRFELWTAPVWLPGRLRADFPQLDVESQTDYDNIEQYIHDADVFLGWSLRPQQLRAAKRLRWIHSPAAGVHLLMSPELAATDIVVTNAREVHGPVVAEHAIALMMALAKRLPSCMRYQREHKWGQEALWDERPRPRELRGSTLCLVGVGSIGRNVALRALAMGMRVICVRQHPDSQATADALAGDVTVGGPSDLDNFLGQADFVVLAAPLTPQTEGMINADRLAKMRPEAYLVNVARGPLVDEAALVNALKAGKIGGAALDVFPAEPLPADSPYWDLENVLITPHSAGVNERLWERHYALIAENMRRFLNGAPLLGVVDKSKGY